MSALRAAGPAARAAGRFYAASRSRRIHVALVVAVLALASVASAADAQAESARLGAALAIVHDGSKPWEDRPVSVPGVGAIGGTTGVVDPGDDLGPHDGVVRTYDTMTFRMSYDVLDTSADGLTLTATLDPELAWVQNAELRLPAAGCPQGASVSADRRVLICRVGPVAVPPAVTGVVEATVRVRGWAADGARPKVALRVSAVNGRPDPDPIRCPQRYADGCGATSEETRVSAALGLETGKPGPLAVEEATHRGVAGWLVQWGLFVLVGSDGDPRGNAAAAPATFHLHDWDRAITATGTAADTGATLVTCKANEARWTCAQPGGPGSPIELTVAGIDADRWMVTGSGDDVVRGRADAHVAHAVVHLFYSRARVEAAGGALKIRNCFATVPGDETAPEFAPVGSNGEPNLGGLPEPLGNNCIEQWLRPGPEVGPAPSVDKYYDKQTLHGGGNWEVVAGQAIATNVLVGNTRSFDLVDVIACDAFDNATQELVPRVEPGLVGNVAAWADAQDPSTTPRETLDGSAAVIEYAAGPWGTWTPAGTTRGNAWYSQAGARCTDALPVNPAGWVSEGDVDFANTGSRRLDAADVNVVRARFHIPLPPQTTFTLHTHLRVRPVDIGSLLVNYGSGYASNGRSGVWVSGSCYGAKAGGSCPDPPQLQGSRPGRIGDARIVVGAPTRVTKAVESNDSVTKNAGDAVHYRLGASVARPSTLPAERVLVASGVVITDVLPAGLTYVAGSAIRASEDANGNGRLDPGEDVDGNGQLDLEAPVPPLVRQAVPSRGATTLEWRVGRIVSGAGQAVIEYDALIGLQVPGGTELRNHAQVRADLEPPARCSDDTRWRCAAALVRVRYESRAAIEKTAAESEIDPGQPARFRLRVANLTNRPIEWFDGVDILPWDGDPRTPASHLSSSWDAIRATVDAGTVPIAVWASSSAPSSLDQAGGSLPDGVVDPVTAYGGPGIGLGSADWPCRLADVGTAACPSIPSAASVTALRVWAADPDPNASGSPSTSFLPVGGAAREVEVLLLAAGTLAGDLLHNEWGGRFDGLQLPAFDGAVVRVPAPPTAASPPPTPTATSTATATPTATPTSTVTATPTATDAAPTSIPGVPLYLPLALRRSCRPRPLELALVLDASSSMRRPSGIGGTKMGAVLSAAGRLVDLVAADPRGHAIAVVGFNSAAWIALPPSRDAHTVREAVAGLEAGIAEGTRLDLALEAGAAALASAPVDRRAMVLLTDGLPNRVPPGPGGTQEETVVSAAERARAQGVVIHTIGYGSADALDPVDRVSPALLAAIAGPGGTVHVAPDSGDLVAVFEAVATDVLCRR